ncbi:MAG: flippase [Thermoanaerobaculaceae bacterium]
MLSWLKSRFGHHRDLLSNTAGLYMESLTSYLFPLITLPYLVRVLGPKGFGILAFGQSLVSYLTIFVDYGFQLYGSRAAASCSDRRLLSGLFWNALLARGLLFAGAAVLLLVLTWWVPKIGEAAKVILFLLFIPLAQALSPTWLYLGCQKMASLAKLNFGVNALAAASIFLSVKGPHNLPVLAAILGLSPLLGNSLAAFMAAKTWPLQWVPPRWKDAKALLKEAFPLFLSTSAIALYTAANSFLLGLLTTKENVGTFAAAEKLVRAAQRLLNPINAALFPVMVQAASISRQELYRKVRRGGTVFIALSLGLAGILILLAPTLVSWLLGADFLASTPVVRLLAVMLPIVAASGVLGLHVLLPLGRDKVFAAIVIGAGVLNVMLALLLVPRLGSMGMAGAIVSTELAVTLSTAMAIVFGGNTQRRNCP